MTASGVYLAADAFMVCLTHAFSTEREEVMGLCIGEIDTNKIVHVVSVIMLRRSDKRKDRVEISPEQLSFAASEAEIDSVTIEAENNQVTLGSLGHIHCSEHLKRLQVAKNCDRLAREMKRPLRVVGWYHSHPHITVWPSHVDVQTQASYQLLDECFVGLIFSCFNDDNSTNQGLIQLTCFQSINQSPEGEAPQYDRLEIPLHIIPEQSLGKACLDALAELPRILTMEEGEAYAKASQSTQGHLLTAIHNGAVYTKSVCHQLERLTGPLLQTLENRLEKNMQHIEDLEREKKQLLEELKGGSS